jgi:hypothetical protein
MPALTMRGRYLMREYWSDSDLHLRLSPEEREFYIGLWMLADDDGWLPRDVPGIGAAVFQYLDRGPREAMVTERLARLREMGKVKSLRCCLYLPSVSRYPRAGKRAAPHHDAHRSHSKGTDADLKGSRKDLNGNQKDLKPSPVPSSSLPDVARATDPDGSRGESKFRQLVNRDEALGKIVQ